MNSLNTVFITFGIALMSGCGADSDTPYSPTKNNESMGTFHVEIEGLVEFDHNSAKAKSFVYRNDYWEFEVMGSKLRMAARFPDEKIGAEQNSIDLEPNNVYFEFMHEINKKRTRVSCKAAQDPVGQIKRTTNADLSSSGRFNIEFVLCRNTYTSEEIAEIKTPITIKGRFENTPNKDALF